MRLICRRDAVGLGCWGFFKYPFLARQWFVWPSWWRTTCPIILAGYQYLAFRGKAGGGYGD